MPGQIRPNKKAAKILYAILRTPKDLRQDNQKKPSERLRKSWFVDSFYAQ